MRNEMKIVAIDTSTAVMAGAALDGDNVLAHVQSEAERNHSIHIMTNIEKLIADSQWSVDDVTHYVVGIGPGSYTGIRIAVTAAKTLAWVTNKTVIAVSSLEGLGYSSIIENQNEQEQLKSKISIIPIMDARRGQVYTANFSYGTTGDEVSWERQYIDHIVMMEDWVDKLTDYIGQANCDEVWIVGDVHLHEAAISRLATLSSKPVHAKKVAMNGVALARLGQLYSTNTNIMFEGSRIHQLAPYYAQLTEAEVKQNAKEKEAKKNG